MGGIKAMRKLPDAVFVIDPKQEEIAVKEARKLGIPVVAVIDTNCDPDMIDYKVPGNDDAIRAIRLFCAAIAEAVIEGKTIYDQSLVKDKEEEKTATGWFRRCSRSYRSGGNVSLMEISAAVVKELRDKTGAGMMDCKKALGETGGDLDKAVDYLRQKGLAAAAKKAGRVGARRCGRRLCPSRR